MGTAHISCKHQPLPQNMRVQHLMVHLVHILGIITRVCSSHFLQLLHILEQLAAEPLALSQDNTSPLSTRIIRGCASTLGPYLSCQLAA